MAMITRVVTMMLRSDINANHNETVMTTVKMKMTITISMADDDADDGDDHYDDEYDDNAGGCPRRWYRKLHSGRRSASWNVSPAPRAPVPPRVMRHG